MKDLGVVAPDYIEPRVNIPRVGSPQVSTGYKPSTPWKKEEEEEKKKEEEPLIILTSSDQQLSIGKKMTPATIEKTLKEAGLNAKIISIISDKKGKPLQLSFQSDLKLDKEKLKKWMKKHPEFIPKRKRRKR